jgi:hypothetical protein
MPEIILDQPVRTKLGISAEYYIARKERKVGKSRSMRLNLHEFCLVSEHATKQL